MPDFAHHGTAADRHNGLPFVAPFAADDKVIAQVLLAEAALPADREDKIIALARRLIEAIRVNSRGISGTEAFLRQYKLSSKEGLALMALAEALLRVPDAETADRLIESKLSQFASAPQEGRSVSLLGSTSAWALSLMTRLVQPGKAQPSVMRQLAKRISATAIRAAMRQAILTIADHFVFGQSIGEGLTRASLDSQSVRYSFDVLGEGARTRNDADRYFDSYAAAINAVGQAAGAKDLPYQAGVSVKLSALHPRYEAVSQERVIRELVPQLIELCRKAKAHNLNFTIDAEEADRLELSLKVIAATVADPSLAGWDGFGLAVQAYQKRAQSVIDWVGELAEAHDRRFMVRLVKGAYWDTEIKRAQERGLADYPVFTRKAVTDLNYIACAERLLRSRPRIFPQFATHNALSIAEIVERAGDTASYEFQRLHGMGAALYETLLEDLPGASCRIYAPVGPHSDLLAYLVRRLLENGANSSFVSVAVDPSVSIQSLVQRPHTIIRSSEVARHPRLPLPQNLYEPSRRNSSGVELGYEAALRRLLAEIDRDKIVVSASPLIGTHLIKGKEHIVISPIDGRAVVGRVIEATPEAADQAMSVAAATFRTWTETPVSKRVDTLLRAADLLEERRGRFLHLLQVEGGKTLDDALAELRESVDFCRYYAAQARKLCSDNAVLPGPTGEVNRLVLRGRGVFVTISPWNFPLAIFLGQLTAALVAGNTVITKPAEQTPLVAFEAVKLLLEAGVPPGALHFIPGNAALGAHLVRNAAVSGVAFTGSAEVARLICRALAAKDGEIVPLVAETGGLNAMIVDSTALPEQVADDVVASAFRSAGQRCSALRILFIQEDVADRMISMIVGAARELRIGDPRDPSTHIGPVIDARAKAKLDSHVAAMMVSARLHYAGDAPTGGSYVAPHIFELVNARLLQREVFGPILHVVRYKASKLDDVLQDIEATGYALTLGVQSRVDTTVAHIVKRLGIGNIYVNRNMIGAVVETQPFGGRGLSGTGPKAGGPHYLLRFVTEQTATINVAAAGGNTSLMTMSEDALD